MPSALNKLTCNFKTGLVSFGLFVLFLVLIFLRPLRALGTLTVTTELYSHVMLIPVLSAYLIWIRRHELVSVVRLSIGIEGGISMIIACVAFIAQWWAPKQFNLSNEDVLFVAMTSFTSFVVSAGVYLGGKENKSVLLFPLGLLFLMVPFPSMVTHAFTVLLQHSSADVAYVLINMTGTPIARDGVDFMLPGLNIQVAEECSGIRSTMVLFITSCVGGCMFLKKTSHRIALVLSVLPIAIMRNGLRILTISWLTVHVDREIINGPVHKHGGPPFFILSLIPLFALLLWFRKRENRARALAGKVDREISAPQIVPIQ